MKSHLEIRQLSLLQADVLATRSAFDCGEPKLNKYLAQTAAQHEKKNITRTFCLVEGDVIVGFMSLTNAEVDASALSPATLKQHKLPTTRFPAVRLCRLAIASSHQRRGLGQLLLISALKKVLNVAELSGCVGLAVDAKDSAAANYYQDFGFEPAPNKPLLLFMPLPTIEELLKA